MEELQTKFQRDGFVKIPPSMYALDDATVQRLRIEFDSLFDGNYETGIYPDEIHWRSGISRPDVTRELCNAWKSSNIIRDVVASESLGQIACKLMGWDCCRLGQDDVIYKPCASNSVVGFHQDGPYISDNFVPHTNNCLTLWIALDDTDQENGALQYAPGSHRWGESSESQQQQHHIDGTKNIQEDVSGSSFHVQENEDYRTPLRKVAAKEGVYWSNVEQSIVTVNVPAGELLVHHQSVWHGSGPNRSQTRLRRSLVAHLIHGRVEWRVHPKPHYIYGRYCIRGEKIPREDFFPITYAECNCRGGKSNSEDEEFEYKRTTWLDGGDE